MFSDDEEPKDNKTAQGNATEAPKGNTHYNG
jgi:hypothetical protein